MVLLRHDMYWFFHVFQERCFSFIKENETVDWRWWGFSSNIYALHCSSKEKRGYYAPQQAFLLYIYRVGLISNVDEYFLALSFLPLPDHVPRQTLWWSNMLNSWACSCCGSKLQLSNGRWGSGLDYLQFFTAGTLILRLWICQEFILWLPGLQKFYSILVIVSAYLLTLILGLSRNLSYIHQLSFQHRCFSEFLQTTLPAWTSSSLTPLFCRKVRKTLRLSSVGR